MQSLTTALALAVALASPAKAPQPSAPQPSPSPQIIRRSGLAALAPADEYFGSFGMSPLSIRSTIGALGRQYHNRTISDRDLLRKALVTEDALRMWRAHYPADPWLAPTFFHLEQLYQAVQTQEARKHATAVLKDIVRNYPTTKEGHAARARLSAGFAALVDESPVLASSSPDVVPSATPVAPASSPSNSAQSSTPAPALSPVPPIASPAP